MDTEELTTTNDEDAPNVVVTLTYTLTDGSTAAVDVDAVNTKEHLQGMQKAAKSGSFFGVGQTIVNPAYIVRVDLDSREEET